MVDSFPISLLPLIKNQCCTVVPHPKITHPKIIPNLGSLCHTILRSVYAGHGETLITWPILNGFPDFKGQQTHDAPNVLLVLFLKKLTIPRQS